MIKELIKIYTTNQNDVQLFSLLVLGFSTIGLLLYIFRVLSSSKEYTSDIEKHNNIVIGSVVYLAVNVIFTALPLFHTYINF